ncbi:3-hydroxyacyl-CoA dehydrogenase/enoyl-CoA hydratase family protein [Caldinitratiruptor microaerophilus]|uniref:3-hydroxyacyl-CoA dehydrogenase n=1 Tax=Caldinitratiruptor microaerophilus TaxID=671077 RepID=A0AA35CII4_9FIRM|nr:3-hydroxyacyl-CoA dehydrogenase/enoyl-CoA hydratase family protein [Caldinitratiruptor microaerophilus]BDG58943.1 3-hydroxyacyl-CoA dehydrogenase [Caldinitratiruptor microaerophilus]
MATTIRRAAVLGAGLMGSQIAALLASCGLEVLLLDIVPDSLTPEEQRRGLTLSDPRVRSRLATQAVERLRRMKPPPLFTAEAADRITPGNLEDDLPRLREADWVLEAVVEDLGVKQDLWRRVAPHVQPGTVLSSNTSGLSIAAQAEALPAELRPHFLGTHFFNPPRYLKLLEVIPTPDTDPEVVSFVRSFATRVLGKGVVIARDTPNFIANRIGTYGLAVTLRAMARFGLGVDEVDAITGPAMGRPKSATFRTLDLVGLDVFAHVARNTRARVADPAERDALELPPYIEEMLRRGWTGDKAGQGFFKKVKGASGESEILALDLQTLEYRPRKKVRFASLDQARNVADPGARLRALVSAGDPAGRFAWEVLRDVLAFCAARLDEIAGGDVAAVDRAMRWGFGWELGPFEAWEALGVRETVVRMEAEGVQVPDWVREKDRFYPPGPRADGPLSFTVQKADPTRVVKAWPGATLVDLGDEVLGLELHGPKQAIGQDYVAAVRFAAGEVLRNWRGLVISAEAPNFSVGANLVLILMAAQDEDWDEIDQAVREFQSANMTLRYLPRPVVVAPYGMTLGGGAEIAFHADRVVAAAELYMGLVEVGVGLIPAGGGTKEMAVRMTRQVPRVQSQLPGPVDAQPFVNRAFEAIATARVSGSAAEAAQLGYLRATDRIVMNRDLLLAEAKAEVLALDRAGYVPPAPERIPVLGPDGRAVLELGIYTLRNAGQATEHDAKVARKIAHVLTGGDLPAGTLVDEQYLLDLEREAFLSLCGEPLSQARMAHLLQTGRPLRN